MQCPVCNVELKIADRQGVEIDYCPKCRGIWLDRGELDKLIERAALEESRYSAPQAAPPPVQPVAPPPQRRDDGYYRYDDDDDYEYKRKNDEAYRQGYAPGQYPPGQYPPKKKKSFLGDMFDIFD